MSSNNWIIITDYVEGRLTQPLPDGYPIPDGWLTFALHDDDNEPYYEGYVKEEDLEDLFYWGAAYAGTTLLYVDGRLEIG